MELKQEFATKIVKRGNFIAKLMPDGYLSIRYKDCDCYGLFLDDNNITETSIARVLDYIVELYPYVDPDDTELFRDNIMLSNSKNKSGLRLRNNNSTERMKMDINVIYMLNNRIEKNALRRKAKSNMEQLFLDSVTSKVRKMLEYDIPEDIIKNIFSEIPEIEIDAICRKHRLSNY